MNNDFIEIRKMDESKRLDAFMNLDAEERFEHLLNTKQEDLCFLSNIERKSIIDSKKQVDNIVYKESIRYMILSVFMFIIIYIIK